MELDNTSLKIFVTNSNNTIYIMKDPIHRMACKKMKLYDDPKSPTPMEKRDKGGRAK